MQGPSAAIRNQCPLATPLNDGLMSAAQAAAVASIVPYDTVVTDSAVTQNTYIAPSSTTDFRVIQFDASSMNPSLADGIALDAATGAGQTIRVTRLGAGQTIQVLLDATAGGAATGVPLFHSISVPGTLSADGNTNIYQATISRAAQTTPGALISVRT